MSQYAESVYVQVPLYQRFPCLERNSDALAPVCHALDELGRENQPFRHSPTELTLER